MAAALRVMLIDDHAVVRTGYRRLLELERDVQVVAEAGDADAALAWLQRGGAEGTDVVVLDLSMPGRSGLDLLRRGRLRWPRLAWLVFTMHDSAAMLGQALRAGAQGFVTKSSEPDELVDAVRRVAAGEQRVVSRDLQPLHDTATGVPPHVGLSPREFDVLRLLVQGLGVAEVASRLHLSPKTVSNLQTRVRQRLSVGNALELLRYAQEHGLI